ncbi:4-galactosyl-N-acetylglucosaminide 3-alpha-L-fucosyltransferase FUT6-like [Rhinophrynus dorsalis]
MADAVVLHHRELCLLSEKLPEIPRPSKQYWVWFNMESPTYSPNLNLMDNVINLTMSYRADSDIFTPYGFLEKYNGAQQFVIPVKTNLLAWVVSNWEPYSRRIQYYEELKKYIQIDLYGKNYKKLPPENHTKIISMYKFYLAFENSIHEDYITEKLWYNALSSGTVPVVMGPPRENYERFIPSDSFIHVDDFSTAQDLALYLQELDKNDTRYKQYFRWRSTLQPVINTDFFTLYCKICKALKEAPAYRTIKSIAKWYK